MAQEDIGIRTYKLLKPSSELSKLLTSIELGLQNFENTEAFKSITVKHKNEKQYTQVFNFIMMTVQGQFAFQTEGPQRGTYSVDVVVYDKASPEVIFTIEAKILPTPKGKKVNDRAESEYVNSSSGQNGAGIQRFKDCNHGIDNAHNLLPESGMLAYITSENFEEWHDKINEWVSKAGWSESEKLSIEYIGEIARFTSQHLRDGGSLIKLHHFWVYVKNK